MSNVLSARTSANAVERVQRYRPLAFPLFVLAVALALGYTSPTHPGWWIVLPGLLLASAILGRWVWLASWLAVAALGANPALASVGRWEIRLSDIPLIALVATAILRGRLTVVTPPLRATALLALWINVATLVAAWREPAYASDALASAARLIATLAVAWVVHALAPSPMEHVRVLRILALAAASASLMTVAHAVDAGGRAGAFGGVNAAGLVAGVLVVLAAWPGLGPTGLRVATGLLGLAALIASMSVGSIAATAIALVVYRRNTPQKWARLSIRGFVLATLAVLVISTLRPEQLPWNPHYNLSSAAVRQTVGYAGLVIFSKEPLVGVGWQRSGRRGVINAPSIVTTVEARFPMLRGYTRVAPDAVTSVHNAYIQVLAEGGLLGLIMAAWVAIILFRSSRTLLHGHSDPDRGTLGVTVVRLLTIVVVWWNDNPLFGGQTESMLFAIAVGLMASALGPRTARHDRSGSTHRLVESIGHGHDSR